MAIFDCFSFYNELDMLALRMREHDPFVDYFVIAEGDHTHSGVPKPLLLNLDDRRFASFRGKIVRVCVNLAPRPCDAWSNERAQRDAILGAIRPSGRDLILISDVDEVISRHYWPVVIQHAQRNGHISIRMNVAYYYLNLYLQEDWTAAKCITYDSLCRQRLSLSEVRAAPFQARPRIYGIPESYGWHFSYIGSDNFIRNKIESFAHQEYNDEEYKSCAAIRRAREQRVDLFNRFGRLVAVPVTDEWPLGIREDPVWEQYICAPDSLACRILIRGWRKLGFVLNGIKVRVRV